MIGRTIAGLAALAAPALVATAPARAQCVTVDPATIEALARKYVDAYVRGDRAKVLAGIAPDARIYGSDAAEVAIGREAAGKLLDLDQRLWQGSAKLGPPTDIAVVASCDLAVITFHRAFSVSGRPPLPGRFTMTWRRAGKAWQLVQSVNTVPTTGQSAADLLGGQ